MSLCWINVLLSCCVAALFTDQMKSSVNDSVNLSVCVQLSGPCLYRSILPVCVCSHAYNTYSTSTLCVSVWNNVEQMVKCGSPVAIIVCISLIHNHPDWSERLSLWHGPVCADYTGEYSLCSPLIHRFSSPPPNTHRPKYIFVCVHYTLSIEFSCIYMVPNYYNSCLKVLCNGRWSPYNNAEKRERSPTTEQALWWRWEGKAPF